MNKMILILALSLFCSFAFGQVEVSVVVKDVKSGSSSTVSSKAPCVVVVDKEKGGYTLKVQPLKKGKKPVQSVSKPSSKPEVNVKDLQKRIKMLEQANAALKMQKEHAVDMANEYKKNACRDEAKYNSAQLQIAELKKCLADEKAKSCKFESQLAKQHNKVVEQEKKIAELTKNYKYEHGKACRFETEMGKLYNKNKDLEKSNKALKALVVCYQGKLEMMMKIASEALKANPAAPQKPKDPEPKPKTDAAVSKPDSPDKPAAKPVVPKTDKPAAKPAAKLEKVKTQALLSDFHEVKTKTHGVVLMPRKDAKWHCEMVCPKGYRLQWVKPLNAWVLMKVVTVTSKTQALESDFVAVKFFGVGNLLVPRADANWHSEMIPPKGFQNVYRKDVKCWTLQKGKK